MSYEFQAAYQEFLPVKFVTSQTRKNAWLYREFPAFSLLLFIKSVTAIKNVLSTILKFDVVEIHGTHISKDHGISHKA